MAPDDLFMELVSGLAPAPQPPVPPLPPPAEAFDAEGRLMITDFIRDFTGIAGEVTFVGRADHFQLWQPEAFQVVQAAARGERRLAGGRSD